MKFFRRCLHLRSLWQPVATTNSCASTQLISTDCSKICDFQTNNVHDERKLKFIKLEVEQLRYKDHRIPECSVFKPTHWNDLLKMESRLARIKFYHNIFDAAAVKEKRKLQKLEKSRAYHEHKELNAKDEHINYSLGNTAVMLRIGSSTMNKWRNNRLRAAMLFGQKIIFDCSYDQHMSRHQANSTAQQLLMSFAANRMHRHPFDVHFCNVNYSDPTITTLQGLCPALRNPGFPLSLHEKSYVDLFDPAKLVYLTPHCRNDLMEYDPDSIYVIGAMGVTHNHEPLSLAKAKEVGIKTARLPLDRYLTWGTSSSKVLNLNQMMDIMLEWKATRCWQSAFKVVPRRKTAQNRPSHVYSKRKV